MSRMKIKNWELIEAGCFTNDVCIDIVNTTPITGIILFRGDK